ncbi:uncharacterized protein N7459_009713 [Penicillium hispanicum]|uniref:uncharacterized protein n=1 Tax=Penicillium hispanicum TaxID=1080232 RepID=UPI0025424D51|nr:uncharacterized protein N7459_009713 [Penicillium hispanicum]KAJ5570283.1 hypothetical protein N7459_009713 [Penicillium hispanicum]
MEMFIGEAQFRTTVLCIRPFLTSFLGPFFSLLLRFNLRGIVALPTVRCSRLYLHLFDSCRVRAFGVLQFRPKPQPLRESVLTCVSIGNPDLIIGRVNLQQRQRISQSDWSIDRRPFCWVS